MRSCKDSLRSDTALVLNGDDLYGAADLARLAACLAGVLCHPVDEPRDVTIALADSGPQVFGVTAVHIHTGRPTAPLPPGCGAMPICAPSRWIFANACAASWAGVGPAAALSLHQYICITTPLPGDSAVLTREALQALVAEYYVQRGWS